MFTLPLPRKRPGAKSRHPRFWDDVLPMGLVPVAAYGPSHVLWDLWEYLVAVFIGA